MKLSALLVCLSLAHSSLCAPEPIRRAYRTRRHSSQAFNGHRHDQGIKDIYAEANNQFSRHLRGHAPNSSVSDENWLTNSTRVPPRGSNRFRIANEMSDVLFKPRAKSVPKASHNTKPRATSNTKMSDPGGPYASPVAVHDHARGSTASSFGPRHISPRDNSRRGANNNYRSPAIVEPSKAKEALNTAPTPRPGSDLTTVHINSESDFALLLPKNPDELIGDAEADGVAFCSTPGCAHMFSEGFITAAAVTMSPDNSSWIQITGCIDPSRLPLSSSDDGGQFDVRFPNGAQCTFGGYGASFIEQVEPSVNRFCLRCCSTENDQINCNSHQDRAGCPTAVPGTYDFPEKGISCS